MVWRSPRFLDSCHLAQMPNKLGLKILSLVALQPGREAIMYKEMLKESSRCGAGCLVSSRNGLCIAGKVVSYDKHILVTAFRCLQLQIVNARTKSLTPKLLQQGYRYHKLRKTFSKFYRRHYELVSKFNVGLKTLLHQGLSEPEFYGDLIYKFKKNCR